MHSSPDPPPTEFHCSSGLVFDWPIALWFCSWWPYVWLWNTLLWRGVHGRFNDCKVPRSCACKQAQIITPPPPCSLERRGCRVWDAAEMEHSMVWPWAEFPGTSTPEKIACINTHLNSSDRQTHNIYFYRNRCSLAYDQLFTCTDMQCDGEAITPILTTYSHPFLVSVEPIKPAFGPWAFQLHSLVKSSEQQRVTP